MNKLRSKKGETLIETMVSLLIIVLSIGIIATTGVLCVKMNKAAKEGSIDFNYDKTDYSENDVNFEAYTLDINNSFTIRTPIYNDNNYLFYE